MLHPLLQQVCWDVVCYTLCCNKCAGMLYATPSAATSVLGCCMLHPLLQQVYCASLPDSSESVRKLSTMRVHLRSSAFTRVCAWKEYVRFHWAHLGSRPRMCLCAWCAYLRMSLSSSSSTATSARSSSSDMRILSIWSCSSRIASFLAGMACAVHTRLPHIACTSASAPKSKHDGCIIQKFDMCCKLFVNLDGGKFCPSVLQAQKT
jgi:hypothetical protein